MRYISMSDFKSFLDTIHNINQRQKLEDILVNIKTKFKDLKEEVKWNQPMFTYNGTFILGFSVSKEHIAVAPEAITIIKFKDELEKEGYKTSNQLFRIRWKDKVNYELIYEIIDYNIESKRGMKTFWR